MVVPRFTNRVFVLYEKKMEKQKKKKKKKNCQIGIFFLNWEKTILFGIGNGADFRPQNWVIESPVTWSQAQSIYQQYVSKNSSLHAG